MTGNWRNLSGAPETGSVICELEAIPSGGTLCCRVGDFPILALRIGDIVKAYVNACPHQYLPLNYKGDQLLSLDGKTVRCTSHGAGFSVETGDGVEGLGVGSSLDSIPVKVNDRGEVVITED